ncbi:amino acid ABC transporter [Shewanella maritima]|uniref:Amino acid ABC transporter n=1 Tax=Shewanella maritima TaxID=2520507 RepID=A0A411PJB4_9GAMM|nr:amino acid ABC transporter [Shewanella maritima]QBF83633.1 amino acid ABC transporter [Shewanella maritima]
MPKPFFIISLLFISLYHLPTAITSVFANEATPTVGQSKSYSFATSNSIEPFFFAHQHRGIQYDLLVAALNQKGIELDHIVFAPNLRALRLVNTQQIDCIINAPADADGLHFTQSLIEYQNALFYLTNSKLEVASIEDLLRYSLSGFQNAKKFLGEEYENMVARHSNYEELSNQKGQVVMLFNGHVEAIVMEEKIFKYYSKLLVGKLDTKQLVTQTNLFKPAPGLSAATTAKSPNK